MTGENHPKYVEPTWNNKLIYTVHLVGYFHNQWRLVVEKAKARPGL